MSEDDKLLEAIRSEADRAADLRPESVHLGTIAERLSNTYPHRTYDEIYEKLQGAFRNRDTFWD